MRSQTAWLFLAVALLGLLVWREADRPWLAEWDQRFHAWIISNSPAPVKWGKQVVLVEIDDNAMEAQPEWPWQALDYALFLRLAEARQPAAVGIVPAIPESAASEVTYDGLLADLMIRAPRLAINAAISVQPDRWAPDETPAAELPVLSKVGGNVTSMKDYATVSQSSAERFRVLVPVGATHAPASRLIEDRVPLAYRFSGSLVPSFVAQVARMALNVAEQEMICFPGEEFAFGDKLELPVDSSASLVADWRALQFVERVSYFDLLVAARQSDQPGQEALLETLRGRVVLLGRTDAASKVRLDSYARPVSEAEYHAMAISMLLNRAWVHRSPWWIAIPVIAGGILLTLTVVGLSRFHALLLVPLVGVLYLALAVGMFSSEGILMPGAVAAAMLIFAFLCTWIKRAT